MPENTYKGVLLSAVDYKENDKLLKLLTPSDGVITAVMRGVKKQTAKMRYGAIPFAFCEYTVYKKNALPIVTGCTQIEDLFAISEDYDKYTAGCLCLEVAGIASSKEANATVFIALLKSLRLILYTELDPYLIATAFVQQSIHNSGYGYEYPPAPKEIATVMELLSFLNSVDLSSMSQVLRNEPQDISDKTKSPATAQAELLATISSELIKKTLLKLSQNFERKFEEEINSKKFL